MFGVINISERYNISAMRQRQGDCTSTPLIGPQHPCLAKKATTPSAPRVVPALQVLPVQQGRGACFKRR